MGCNLQFDNQLGCWDTHNSQLCNKEQALVGGLYHVSIPWVSLQGVHLAKSTFPVSCLPLQAGNITKMFEITRGTLQHALATKFARQANQFCCHVEHQIKCCLYTREGNNRSCKIEIVQMQSAQSADSSVARNVYYVKDRRVLLDVKSTWMPHVSSWDRLVRRSVKNHLAPSWYWKTLRLLWYSSTSCKICRMCWKQWMNGWCNCLTFRGPLDLHRQIICIRSENFNHLRAYV
jgi:hypothetical protein